MVVYQPKVCSLSPLVLHIRTQTHNHTMDLGMNNCFLVFFSLCLISVWHLRLEFWAEFYRGMCFGKLPITLNWRTWNLTEAHELPPPLGTLEPPYYLHSCRSYLSRWCRKMQASLTHGRTGRATFRCTHRVFLSNLKGLGMKWKRVVPETLLLPATVW